MNATQRHTVKLTFSNRITVNAEFEGTKTEVRALRKRAFELSYRTKAGHPIRSLERPTKVEILRSRYLVSGLNEETL